MNAVELEAYKLEQDVDVNTNYMGQSASAIQTYYDKIIEEEKVIKQVNINIGRLSTLVDDAYNSVMDQNTSVSDSKYFVKAISEAIDKAKGYHDVGTQSQTNIGIYESWILEEYDLIKQYADIIDQKKGEMDELYNRYIIAT